MSYSIDVVSACKLHTQFSVSFGGQRDKSNNNNHNITINNKEMRIKQTVYEQDEYGDSTIEH